ncbi:MAG: Undecaprenyl-diphosphatase [Syntrophus sp. PtaU1.Bin208]|nr:MAG: Undecaprenyl-diphosphatase [Syntrophus sp. PtaU1.Bin208]
MEFSFLLAVPTMLAATAYDLLKSGSQFSLDQVQFLAVGFVTSFVVALLSIKFLLRYIQTHTFIAFGIYRIALVIIWVIFL